MSIVPACMHVHYVFSAQGDQKRMSVPLKLKLRAVVSHLHRFLKLNSGPLLDQKALLTAPNSSPLKGWKFSGDTMCLERKVRVYHFAAESQVPINSVSSQREEAWSSIIPSS